MNLPDPSSSHSPSDDPLLDRLQGQVVVLDLSTPYVCLGTLAGCDHRYLILNDADMHDLRDSSTTRELYVLDARRHGIGSNRKRVYVRREEVVALSLLDDVLE